MGAVPGEAVGGVKPPGLLVLPQDEHEGVGKPRLLHPAAGLVEQQPAIAPAPLGRVGVKGGDLPPVGIGGVVEGADVAGVVVHRPGLAVVEAGHWLAPPAEEQAVDAVLGLVVGPEHLYPAVVGDLRRHVVGGHRVRIGVPPAQGVDEGHGPEVFLGAGVHKSQLFHKNLPNERPRPGWGGTAVRRQFPLPALALGQRGGDTV